MQKPKLFLSSIKLPFPRNFEPSYESKGEFYNPSILLVVIVSF